MLGVVIVIVIDLREEDGGHPPSRRFGAAGRPPLQVLRF
jgi:hypothetical protein